MYVYVVETDSIITMKGWAKSSQTDTAAFLSLTDIAVINYGLRAFIDYYTCVDN
jgi:hypothetical protein